MINKMKKKGAHQGRTKQNQARTGQNEKERDKVRKNGTEQERTKQTEKEQDKIIKNGTK